MFTFSYLPTQSEMGNLAFVPGGEGLITNIYWIALDLQVEWIYDQQDHLAYVLAKASIVLIVPSNPMTCIIQQRTSLSSCTTNPSLTSAMCQILPDRRHG